MYRAAVGVDRVGVGAAVEEELGRLDVPYFADIHMQVRSWYKYTTAGSLLVQMYNCRFAPGTNIQCHVHVWYKFTTFKVYTVVT